MQPEPHDDDLRLLTAAQVAEIMAVSRDFVYELCAAGELESIVLSGRRNRRIKAASVKAWIDRQPSEPDSAW